ncbi:unnamed protein product, partial [Mesorhabditis belari]|uniref:Uncharacterized protein n=1 Tax=Mesorhabditis belari TaxID=2138241 RepID=A0AAF3J5Q1_9BILA
MNRCRQYRGRRLSDIDYSKEKPTPWQLEHIQTRLIDTTPHFFRQRIDYTFYHRDVVLENQIIGRTIRGRDMMMHHFGFFSVMLKMACPHIEMECVDCHPQIEDGTVRLRWRIKYVSWLRLAFNPLLFRFNYRLKNLSWYDGYSVLDVDGNGDVYKMTVQKSRRDESYLLKGAENLKKTLEKAVVPKPASTVNSTKDESQKR